MRKVQAMMSDDAKRELKSRSAVYWLQIIKEKPEHKRGCKLTQQTRRQNLNAAEQ